VSEDKPQYTPDPPKMVLNKEGLLVPAESIPAPCNHVDVANRVQKSLQQRNQYHCHGCDEKVQVAYLNFLIGKPEELDVVLAQMAAAQQAARAQQERKKSGLVLPGEKP